MQQKLTWYFDFISPFAYLQYSQFKRLPSSVTVEYKPILFAGLLGHWKNVGPAEIAPKRIFTYKHCYWLARKMSVPFKMPPAHPFKSLSALRLAIAAGSSAESVQSIFEAIWKMGYSLESGEAIKYLESASGIRESTNGLTLAEMISAPEVKEKLRTNTEQAAKDNVFGVPTFVVQDKRRESFWGLDAFDMLLDYLEDPKSYYDEEMTRIESLPEGIQRKR